MNEDTQIRIKKQTIKRLRGDVMEMIEFGDTHDIIINKLIDFRVKHRSCKLV